MAYREYINKRNHLMALIEKGCYGSAEELANDEQVRRVYLGKHFELLPMKLFTEKYLHRHGKELSVYRIPEYALKNFNYG